MPSRENLSDSAPPADAAWHGTLEPLADGWGAKLLLARAAAYAKHRDNFSTLFNIETFKPLVAGPPFVRALEELVAANRGVPPDARLDVAGVRTAFFAGQSAMALTWPTAAGRGEVGVKVGFAELPGGTQMFNFASDRWDERTADESIHVPIVPLDGRLGVVLKGSEHETAALGLLTWLAGEKWGTRVSSASVATTLYRRSQLKEVAEWVEPDLERGAAREYAKVVADGSHRDRCGSPRCGFPAGRSITRPWTRRSDRPCVAKPSLPKRCKSRRRVSSRSASGSASSSSGPSTGGIWGWSPEAAANGCSFSRKLLDDFEFGRARDFRVSRWSYTDSHRPAGFQALSQKVAVVIIDFQMIEDLVPRQLEETPPPPTAEVCILLVAKQTVTNQPVTEIGHLGRIPALRLGPLVERPHRFVKRFEEAATSQVLDDLVELGFPEQLVHMGILD